MSSIIKAVVLILLGCLFIGHQTSAQWQEYLFTRHLSSPRDIIVSPNGQTMALHDHSSVLFFDLNTGKRTYIINDFNEIRKKLYIDDRTMLILSTNRLELYRLGKDTHQSVIIADDLSFRPNTMAYDANTKQLCLAGLYGIRTYQWNDDGAWEEALDYKPVKTQRGSVIAQDHVWTAEAHKKIVKVDKASGARLDSLENEGQGMATLYFDETRQVLWYAVRMPKGKSRLKLLDIKTRELLINYELDEPELKKVWKVNDSELYLRGKNNLYRMTAGGQLLDTLRQSKLKQKAIMSIQDGMLYYGIGGSGYYGQKKVTRFELETMKELPVIYPNAEFNRGVAVSPKGALAIDKSDGVSIISPKGKVIVADEMTVQSLRLVNNHNLLFARKMRYGNGVDSLVRVNLRSGKFKYYPKPLERVSEFGMREVAPAGKRVKILNPQKKVFRFHPNGKSDSLSAFFFSGFEPPEGIDLIKTEYRYANMRFFGGGKWLVQDFDWVKKYFIDIYQADDGKRLHRLLKTSYVPSNQVNQPLLYDRETSMLFLYNIANGFRQDLWKVEEKPDRALLSKDQTKLIYHDGSELNLVNLADGSKAEFGDVGEGAFVLSPNEAYLLVTRWAVIHIYDVTTGKRVGALQTAQSKKDYVIFMGNEYDGTPEGLDLLLLKNPKPQFKRVKGLYRKKLIK